MGYNLNGRDVTVEKQIKTSPYNIAAAYTGTVVGAGFASGQEIMQFFAAHGLAGFRGIILTSLLFIIFGYILLELGRLYGADSHQTIINLILGRRTSRIIDYTITCFLFFTLTAMIAGTGALFNEYIGLPIPAGNLIMSLAVLATVYLGIGVIIRALSAVVPFLMTGIFSIALLAIFDKTTNPLPGLKHIPLPDIKPPVPGWGFSALVYTSYNLIIAIGILAPLGNRIENKRTAKAGALLGGLALGAGAAAVMLSLFLNFPRAGKYEIPMLFAVSHYSPVIHFLFTLLVFTEIYSTAVGNLYGLTVRLNSSYNLSYKKVTFGLTLSALLASGFGFSRLIHYFYPVAGLTGIILLLALTREALKSIKVII
ncbi:MAG: hypothetical protein ACOCQC_03600 [Halanaerobiaceae bacterium]